MIIFVIPCQLKFGVFYGSQVLIPNHSFRNNSPTVADACIDPELLFLQVFHSILDYLHVS